MADIKIVTYTWFGFPGGTAMPAEVLISHRDLGGRTPKAALFFGNAVQDTTNVPTTTVTPTPDLAVVIGATDGVRQWCVAAGSADQIFGVTKVNRFAFTDRCFVRPDTFVDDDLQSEFEFSAFVPNGVVLRQLTAKSGFTGRGFPVMINTILFAGDDLDAYCNISPDLGAAPGTTTVNTVGFNPDAVFVGSIGLDFATRPSQAFTVGFGCAVNDGSDTNRSLLWASPDGSGANNATQSLLTDAAGGVASSAAAAINYKTLINNFTGAGFDVVTDASAGNNKIGYLALNLGGANSKLYTSTSPVATGVQSDTNPGFRPQFGMMCNSGNDAVDTPLRNDNRAGGFAMAAFSSPYASNTAGVSLRMNTGIVNLSLYRYNAFYADGTSNSLFRGKTPTFTANGWDINFVSANATARKGWAFAVEQQPSTGVIDQTMPGLSQTLVVPNGPRKTYILTGSGNLTVWSDWNNSNFRIYAFGGGQAGETADATKMYGGSGGCGALTVAVTSPHPGFLTPGEVLTYQCGDWMDTFMPPAGNANGPRGNDTSVLFGNLSFVILAGGGQNQYGNTSFQNNPNNSPGNGNWFQSGNTGGRQSLNGTGGTPGSGGGAVSLPFIPGYSTPGNRTAGFGGYAQRNAINAGSGADAQGGYGGGIGGGGGAGFTDVSDVTGPEHRDGDLSSQTVVGMGGTTTTSAADGGSVGLMSIGTDGPGSAPGTTPIGGNWFVDRDGNAVAPGSGAAGGNCELDDHGLFNAQNTTLVTKADYIAAAAAITDWNATLSGTLIGPNGADGAFPGGAGSGGSNCLSDDQAKMGLGGRGAPGAVIFDYLPLNLPSNGEEMSIEDEVDANIIANGGVGETMSIVDIVDAQLLPKASWLTIGGDARTSIFPN